MIKVLMVGNSSTVKGGITTVINQFRNYNFQNYNIKLKFIPTYKDTNNLFKILYFFIAYIKIFIECIIDRPNIIHIHMSYKGSFSRAYFVQKLAMIFHIKNIIHLHGSEFKKWYESVDEAKKLKIKKLLINADQFIVLGKQWYTIIKNIEPKTKIIILNNSVKIPSETVKYKDKKTILFLGVLIKRKGVHDLIEALNKTNDKNIEVLIAGSGEEELNLKNMVTKYNIKNVKFLGWIDNAEKEKLLLKSQFMILPTYNEGLPMSILEAMSYGVPVISTYVGDISTVVEDAKNGFLYNSGDVKILTQILKKSFEITESEWKKLSKNARETIINDFSEENYFKNIIKIYNTK